MKDKQTYEYSVNVKYSLRMWQEVQDAVRFVGLNSSDWLRHITANALHELHKQPAFKRWQDNIHKEGKD